MGEEANQDLALEQKENQDQVPVPEFDHAKTPSPTRIKAKKRVSHENNDTVFPRIELRDSDESEDEEEEVHFLAPAEGTPAALALQG
jgi:hypothetical protein